MCLQSVCLKIPIISERNYLNNKLVLDALIKLKVLKASVLELRVLGCLSSKMYCL